MDKTVKKIFLFSTFSFFLFLPFKTSFDDISLIIIIISSIYLIYKGSKPFKIDTIIISVLSFFAFNYFSSVLVSNYFSQEIKDILRITVLFIIYKNINIKKNEIVTYIILPLSISSIILLTCGIYKFYFLHDYSRFHLFTNINRSSIYSLISLSFILPFSLDEKNKYKLVFLFSCLILLITIFMLGSRTSIVLSFVLILFYLFCLNQTIALKNKFLFLVLLLVISLIVYFINYDLLHQKIENLTNATPRLKIWAAGLDTFLNSKKIFFGLGTGEFYTVDFSSQNSHIFKSAHNLFLELLIENGLFGLSLYLLSLFFILKNIINNYSSIYFQSAILTFLAHIGTSMTESTLIGPHGMLLFTIFGLYSNNKINALQYKEHRC